MGISGFKLKRLKHDLRGYYPVFSDALTVPGGTLLAYDDRRCTIIGRTWVPVIDPSCHLGWVHREAIQAV